MSNEPAARCGYRGDSGYGGEGVFVADPAGMRPGDQELSRGDGAHAWLREERRSRLGDQLLQLRRVLGSLGLEHPDSSRYLTQRLGGDAGLDIAGAAAKVQACAHQLFGFESDQTVMNWLGSSYNQGIELIQGLPGRADRTLSSAEEDPNCLSAATLTRKSVVLTSQGFAGDLDGVRLVRFAARPMLASLRSVAFIDEFSAAGQKARQSGAVAASPLDDPAPV